MKTSTLLHFHYRSIVRSISQYDRIQLYFLFQTEQYQDRSSEKTAKDERQTVPHCRSFRLGTQRNSVGRNVFRGVNVDTIKEVLQSRSGAATHTMTVSK